MSRSPSPEDRRSHEAVDKLQTMYDQLLAEQETLKDKLADLEHEKRDGGRRGPPRRRPARATADARRAQRTRERDGDASEGDASRAQSQQSRRGPDRSFGQRSSTAPDFEDGAGPRGDAPRRPRDMRRAPAEPPAARNRWGGVVDEAEEAKKAAEKRKAKGGAFAHKKTVPRVPKPRHGRPVPKPSPEKPAPRKTRAGKPAARGGGRPAAVPPDGDGDDAPRPRRRSPKKRPKPLVAGHADRTPRPPPPDDGVDAAEPELRSTSQWWPVNTDLAPFSGAPGEVHNSASI